MTLRISLTQEPTSFTHLKLTVHLCKTTDERADLLTKAMGKDNASYKLFRDDIMNVRSVA